ncbi:hypothetical protein GmHk_05G013144 [Glycine max]|nr:hypothetical protein GmHk_05G013144 [Glycine max]
MVHVDPTTGKADGPHKKKLRTYLGIVARDKVDAEFDILKHLTPTRTAWMTLFVKNTTLARRNGPNFVRPVEIPRGRMCRKRRRPSRSKTSSPTCCLMGVMNI